MGYEQPLAYVLGIEGLALLRAFGGEHGREFVEARIREIRALLDDPALTEGVTPSNVDTADGYRLWAPTYDGPNSAFAIDEPIVREFLADLPAGPALDAACGTGRYAGLLAERGHDVIGVDGSPEMLAHARKRLPDADFRVGALTALPVESSSVDVVTCGLALTHVPSLDPVLAEFARVLRPGGHALIVDMHPERVLRGAVPPLRDASGRPTRLPTHRHLVGDYVRAALAAGLQGTSVRGTNAAATAGPEHNAAGPEHNAAGPEHNLARPEHNAAGPERNLAGPEGGVAGPVGRVAVVAGGDGPGGSGGGRRTGAGDARLAPRPPLTPRVTHSDTASRALRHRESRVQTVRVTRSDSMK